MFVGTPCHYLLIHCLTPHRQVGGNIHVDDSTWCLVDEGKELQVLLATSQKPKWKVCMSGSCCSAPRN